MFEPQLHFETFIQMMNVPKEHLAVSQKLLIGVNKSEILTVKILSCQIILKPYCAHK